MKKLTTSFSLTSVATICALLCACSSDSGSHTGPGGGSASSSGTSTSTGTNTTSTGTNTTSTSTTVTPGAPSAVTGLELVNEGPSTMSITWTAAVAGSNPIDHYKIYRNGVAYATVAAPTTAYTDANATNATVTGAGNNNNPQSAATVYSYNVSAVDSTSTEGPQASQLTAWWYHNGKFSAGGEYSSAQGGNPGTLQGENNGTQSTTNWCSTGVASATGAPCVAYVTSTNWWQPYSGGSISPEYAMDIGAFNYLNLDIYSSANQEFVFAFFSRGPAGDLFNNITVDVNGTANQWQHVKIALTPTANATQNLGFGFGTATGTFVGTNLTGTWTSGVKFEPCTWVTGAGVAANTMINYAVEDQGNAEAGQETGLGNDPGGYNVTTSQNVGPIPLNFQRTNAYKLHVEAKGNAPYYVDNLSFTLN